MDMYKLPSLHKRIMKEYQKTKETLPKLLKRIEHERFLARISTTPASRKSHNHNASVLQDRVNDIQNDWTCNQFLMESRKLLCDYKQLGVTKKVISFKVNGRSPNIKSCSSKDDTSQRKHGDDCVEQVGHLEHVYASQKKLQQMWNKKDIEIVRTPSLRRRG